jgi:hypothetical protein
MEPGDGRIYRIEVRGPLPAGTAGQFPGMAVESAPGATTLSGAVIDTAALYGLIARLESLGLALMSVRPEPPAADGAGGPGTPESS